MLCACCLFRWSPFAPACALPTCPALLAFDDLQVEDRQAAAGSMGYLDFMQQLQKMLMSKAG